LLLLLIDQGHGLSLATPPSSWKIPTDGLSGQIWNDRAKPQLTPCPRNATLPLALTVVAPDQFPSISKARNTIRHKKILVSGTDDDDDESSASILGKSDTRIYPGDVIRIKMAAATSNDDGTSSSAGYPNLSYSKAAGMLPQVVYEDDDVAVINKLAGMITHSIDNGGFDANSVLRVAPLILTPPTAAATAAEDALKLPALVHRLDTKTSGLLMLAKTKTASVSLSQQFETRQVSKTYQAIVEGRPTNDEGLIESIVNGKVAESRYTVLRSMPTSKGIPLTWIEFSPATGRRHQLRQHASYELHCPIVGDVRYDSSWSKSSYMYLCATRLSCWHPRRTNELLEVEIPAPNRFDKFWEREKGRYDNYQQWLSLDATQHRPE
jgi:23S rRNA pseudouridine1911/1915/1917 synthase